MFEWIVIAIVVDSFVIVANSVQFVIMVRKWKRLDRIEHILFSLCIADLTSGISAFGQDSYQLKKIVTNKKTDMSDPVSLFFDCLFIFFIIASCFHVVAIAIERITAVRFPLKYSKFTTTTCKVFTVSFIWTLTVVLAPTITMVNRYSKTHTNMRITIGVIVFLSCLIVFISYMLLTFLLIKRQRELNEILEPHMSRQVQDRQMTMICLFFGLSFVTCMLPYSLALLIPVMYHPIVNVLLTAYHLLNPNVYFVKVCNDKSRPRSNTLQTSGCNLITRSPNLTRTTIVSTANEHEDGNVSVAHKECAKNLPQA